MEGNMQFTDATTAEPVGLSEKAIAWLEARGLDPEIALRAGLQSYSDANGEGIQLPYPDGKWKRRNLADKSIQYSSGGTLGLFNAQVLTDETLKHSPVLITEGEWDCLAGLQSRHYRTVSLPNGANSLTDEVYDFIVEHVADDEEIIIAADSDKDGEAMLQDVSTRLGKSRCKRLTYPKQSATTPDRCKDLNEVLQRYSAQAVEETLKRAEFVHVPGIYKMSELPELPERELYPIGVSGLDKIKIRKGDWSVVSGIPGNGKTSFMNDWTCSLARKNNWRIAFASFEQPPQTDHRENLRGWFLNGNPKSYSQDKIEEADRWIDQHFVFFVADEEQEVSIEWLYEMMEVAVRRYGVDMIVLDPWNEIEHSKGRNESQTEYVGSVLRFFRRFARSKNIHLTIVAHPAKIKPKDSDGGLRCPTLYDISDSANWNNKCDIGFIVHRDLDTDTTMLRVEKCRYGAKLGISNREDFSLGYNTITRRYFAEQPNDGAYYDK